MLLIFLKLDKGTAVDIIARNEFYTLAMTINCKRNEGFYTGLATKSWFQIKTIIVLMTLGIILALNNVKVDFNRSKKVTILMPIIFLTLLAPIGLILPADAGEKMGLQITVMLTVVIYIDVISNSIPGAF